MAEFPTKAKVVIIGLGGIVGASIAHHIGIYLGGDQMIDAPESGELVRVDSLTSGYYQSQQWRVVRYG